MPPPIPQSATVNNLGQKSDRDFWLDGFTRLALLHPDKTAVVAGSMSITYGELEYQAGTVTSALHAEGIGKGHYVGAGFHRSIELISSLIGILKSGAAYIPIDPSYPADRIARMIASAKLRTVITSPDLAAAFPGVKIIFPNRSDVKTPAPTVLRASGEEPVYAIFTSGSTGHPKAASVFHSGFSNLLEWYRNELQLGADDRTLVISSPSFDLTQKNLFTPLLTGGTLVLDDCQSYDITRILGLIRAHGITLINCTPSAFYPLVDAAGADFAALASLRFAVLGGEPISIPRLRAWLEHPACRAEVVNSYGPTECTDICLFHRMHRANLDEFPFVPLGREIPNVEVSIRDEMLNIIPDGETGELCIGGAGVGAGYLFDPTKTADKFVGGIYRTGDLAKRLPCGTFEFRGRADHQVKVNGHRIELGEIEITLNEHPDVRESMVTSSEGTLTAHVRGNADPVDLRAHLASKLPAYMIPAEFLILDVFPLTPNGKVDRNALAAKHAPPAAERPIFSGDSLENRILSLWSEVLGKPVTDATANFFDLGGNSIHLAVVHVKLREMTGNDFPITDLFAHPSARAIANHLSPRKEQPAHSGIQERARLAKAGFARFQRPLNR